MKMLHHLYDYAVACSDTDVLSDYLLENGRRLEAQSVLYGESPRLKDGPGDGLDEDLQLVYEIGDGDGNRWNEGEGWADGMGYEEGDGYGEMGDCALTVGWGEGDGGDEDREHISGNEGRIVL